MEIRKTVTPREPCPGCGGSGQISFFKGVSRFLLSCEECPECAGLGFLPDPAETEKPGGAGGSTAKVRRQKKTKEQRP